MAKLPVLLCFIVCVTTLLHRKAKAQDIPFSQYYANPIYVNPAFAGSLGCPRVVLQYRDQWPAATGLMGRPFVSYALSFDRHVKTIGGGVGAYVLRDHQNGGTMQVTMPSIMYAYAFKLSRDINVRAGLQFNYLFKAVSLDGFTFSSQLDPLYGASAGGGSGEVSSVAARHYIDATAGAAIYGRDWFVGVAGHHLPQLKPIIGGAAYQTDFIARKYTVNAGLTLKIKSRARSKHQQSFVPSFIGELQGKKSHFNYGMYYNMGALVLGSWFRHDLKFDPEAMVFLCGVKKKSYSIGYSFDLPLNELGWATFGAHELSVSLFLPCGSKAKKFKALSCPSF